MLRILTIIFLVFTAKFAVAQNYISVEVNKGKIVDLKGKSENIFIGNHEIADVAVHNSSKIYVYGKKIGSTSVHVLDKSGNAVLNAVVNVTHDLGPVQYAGKAIDPKSNLSFTSVENGLVMQGDISDTQSAERIKTLISGMLAEGENIVDITNVHDSKQVMIKVRIAELSRSRMHEFGINVRSLFDKGGDVIEFIAGGAVTNGTNILTAASMIDDLDVTTVVDLLETEGLLKILAEPTLTAKSGHEAEFLAGGEFPVPIPQDDNTITVEYKEFGVGLKFKPIIISDDMINLEIAPEVSSLSSANSVNFNGFVIPSIVKRSSKTVVDLKNGESIAIAGLLQHDNTTDVNKTPWLGDLPILGALFRSTSFTNNESELAIIITPHIVNASKKKIKLPTDDYIPANDIDRVLFGKMEGYKPEPVKAPEQPAVITKPVVKKPIAKTTNFNKPVVSKPEVTKVVEPLKPVKTAPLPAPKPVTSKLTLGDLIQKKQTFIKGR